MRPLDDRLMEADSLLVQQKYAEALEAFKNLVGISETQTSFTPDGFKWQLLILIRLQRVYRALNVPAPAPLEKLVKYYEIVARNHPQKESVTLTREEAMVCPRVMEWLPKAQADNTVAPSDPAGQKDLTDGILHLLEQNKNKYKLGVFYKKGF
jgi:hypothetical protein